MKRVLIYPLLTLKLRATLCPAGFRKMVWLWSLLLLIILPLKAQNPIRYVNPFIGTAGGGNTHPGATTPFGMLALSPHTEKSGWRNMGYRHEDQWIIGFVQNQVSGIGNSEFGNILIMPKRGGRSVPIDGLKSRRKHDIAIPGFYSVELIDAHTTVEITSSRRFGKWRFTFTDTTPGDTLAIVIHATHASFPQTPRSAKTKIDHRNKEVHISTVSEGGFGEVPPESLIHFAAQCSEAPAHYSVWVNGKETAGQDEIESGLGEESGAVLFFIAKGKSHQVEMTTAISYRTLSAAIQHCRNGANQTFRSVKKDAEKEWNRMLSRVTLEGGRDEDKVIAYSALYHALLMPTDIRADAPEPYHTKDAAYTNYFAIWDTYRTQSPLLALLYEEHFVEQLNALLDIADHTGWLPDGVTGNALTPMQGGTNADVLFADAFKKRLRGVDYERALRYMLKNATIPGDQPHHKKARAYRGRFEVYLKQGWIPSDSAWLSVSKTLEYAYNDACIASMLKAYGRHNEADILWKRALSLYTLFDSATGFFRPKRSDGTWEETWSPHVVFPAGVEWTDEVHYYEGSAWQYLGYVPHDLPGLIERLGGPYAFEAKWDTLLLTRPDMGFEGGYFSVSNEPAMLSPYLYHYIGRPDKTNSVVRDILRSHFKATPDGLPGNDDSGTTSSWYIWSSLGLFPMAGQGWYFITAPLFTKATLTLKQGTLIIEAPLASKEHRFVTGIYLNGKPLHRHWVWHHEIATGGRLTIDLAQKPHHNSQISPPPDFFQHH